MVDSLGIPDVTLTQPDGAVLCLNSISVPLGISRGRPVNLLPSPLNDGADKIPLLVLYVKLEALLETVVLLANSILLAPEGGLTTFTRFETSAVPVVPDLPLMLAVMVLLLPVYLKLASVLSR